ncbi:GNAT family N-acetyltransferase [Paenibacillus assamensis]|uniref:GNAT family N-acetyltransferase n=1 Tax=Paenibacillus assamensis TaxID=311244 RepID=UPI00048D059D|nr:GNAT family protein [Paenibacillus assamensis]
MRNFPTLETERLILGELRSEDAVDVFHYFSKDEVTQFYDLESFTEVKQAENLITNWNNRYNNQQGIRWGIVLKTEKRVIGTCGYHNWSSIHYRAEIGYELSPEYWRQGIMFEALSRVISYGFEELELNRIGALVYPHNIGSRNLLISSGFSEEGILKDYYLKKDRFVDAVIFSTINKNKRQNWA